MAFTLTNVPGFADLPDVLLDAEKFALGMNVARISGNAAFGMVRPEIFVGLYKDGEEVNLPISPIDGYAYSRNELLYAWGLYSSVDAGSGWKSGNGDLWFAAWKVEQATGKVSSVEYYRSSEGDVSANTAQTKDGVLVVFTIAQRQKDALVLSVPPAYVDQTNADLQTDHAVHTGVLKALNRNAKFSVVGSEIIYCGEFYNGQTVPRPVSPADGYIYEYNEVRFMHSWRWTTQGTSFQQPDLAFGQLNRMEASVGLTGAVTTNIIMAFDHLLSTAGWGRIAVFAFCTRAASPASNTGAATVSVGSHVKPWEWAINAAYDYGEHTGQAPVIVPLPLVAGQTVLIEATGGSVAVSDSRSAYNAAGDPGSVTGTSLNGHGKRYPTYYMPGSTLGLGGLCGAWTDAAGHVIEPLSVGLGNTFTAPAGATQLQLGINDDEPNDNRGGPFTVDVSLGGVGPEIVLSGADFAEIDPVFFFPGEELPASVMAQINSNIKEAVCRPEFFGPATYSNGATVPLPKSPIDDYQYSRDELIYIYDWATTAPETYVRFVTLSGNVNQATGYVSTDMWRQPVGHSPRQTHDGSLRVLVAAFRKSQAPALAPIETQPPDYTGSGGTFSSMSPSIVVRQAAGEATTLRMDAFDVLWTTGITSSYDARAFTIPDPGATPVVYYVTIYDPTQVGDSAGALTAYCETTSTRAKTAGYIFAGKIIATHAGGNNGGPGGTPGIDALLVVVG
ncbi:MAG TPA: hypothetical protein VN622_10895 [Clostridia bacterium]|nr:hypothetical protein [Clostridia bacterium]